MTDTATRLEGARCRAVAKIADHVLGVNPLDPNDPDLVTCRAYGAKEAAGHFTDEYQTAVMAAKKSGCTCEIRRDEVTGAIGVALHESGCPTVRWREQERAERQERLDQHAAARRRGGVWREPVGGSR